MIMHDYKHYKSNITQSYYNKDGTVTLNEWMVWITQKKQERDRKNWIINPGKSFI